jgi:nitrous oxidase accessory protein
MLFPSAALAETNELQELIDQTPENEELILEDKTYHGNVIIDKPMTVTGTENTVIEGDSTDNVIEVASDDVNLDTLKVRKSGSGRDAEEEYSGIRVMGNRAVIHNVHLSEVYHGIYLNSTEDVTITDSMIYGQRGERVADQGNGIHVVRSGTNMIENNYIEGTRDGIFVEYSNHNEINNNTATETRYGLHYMYSNNNHFKDNHFVGNTGGAAIMHSDNIMLENNSFSFNQGSRSFGLIIQSSREIEVINNEFHLNQRGLYLEQSTNNRVEKNEFFHNQIGVEIWTSATAHIFVKNKFNNNNSNLITVGGVSNNEWHENGAGNYWNSPMLDLDQDGVGDSPIEYTSSLGELIERNELTYLFLSSPAITIYEKMNELFSNQEVMAVDEYPLMMDENRSVSITLIGAVFLITVLPVFIAKRRKNRWPIYGRKH